MNETPQPLRAQLDIDPEAQLMVGTKAHDRLIAQYVEEVVKRPVLGAFTDPYDGWHIVVVPNGKNPSGFNIYTATAFMLMNASHALIHAVVLQRPRGDATE